MISDSALMQLRADINKFGEDYCSLIEGRVWKDMIILVTDKYLDQRNKSLDEENENKDVVEQKVHRPCQNCGGRGKVLSPADQLENCVRCNGEGTVIGKMYEQEEIPTPSASEMGEENY